MMRNLLHTLSLKLFRLPVLIVGLMLALGASFYFSLNDDESCGLPQPIQTVLSNDSLERENFRKDRNDWMELMHRTAPGTDWRKIEQSNHDRRGELLTRMLQSGSQPVVPGALNVEWKEIGSNNLAGRMLYAELDWSDSTLYAASEGGNIWYRKWPDSDWTCMNDHFNIDHIIYLKSLKMENQHRIIAFNSDAHVYFSDNFGNSWTSSGGLSGPQNWGNIRRAVMLKDSLSTAYVLAKEWDYSLWTQSASIYQSKNQAGTFAKIYTVNLASEACDLAADPEDVGSAFYLQQNQLYRLEDDSLIAVSTIPFSGQPERVHLAAAKFGAHMHLYAAFSVNEVTSFYFSLDDGTTWNTANSLPFTAFDVNSMYASQTYPGRVFFAGVECFQSDNYGVDWSIVNNWAEYYGDVQGKLHADIPAVQSTILPTGEEIYFISTDGGLYKASNPLLAVENISLDGLRVSQYYSVLSNKNSPDLIYAGSQDQGFQASISGSGDFIDFDQTISGDYGHLVSGNDGQSLWTVYPSFLMYYSDLTAGFDASYYSFEGSNFLWMPPLCEHPYSSAKVLLGGGGIDGGAHIILCSYSNSITASELPFDFSEGNPSVKVSAIGYSRLSPDYWYVSTNEGSFFYSDDAGASWTKNTAFSAPESHYFYGSDILTSPVDPAIVWVAGSGYSNPAVYKSSSYGQSFTAKSTGLPATLVYELAINADGDLLFAATEAGPYVFVDSLNRWFDLAAAGAPDQVYWGVEYIESIDAVRFATYGRGIWQCSVQELMLNPEQNSTLSISVFPNPFVSNVMISSDLLPGSILQIYNSAGTLMQIAKPDASSISLDLAAYPSGLYFLNCKSKSGSKTYKLVKK